MVFELRNATRSRDKAFDGRRGASYGSEQTRSDPVRPASQRAHHDAQVSGLDNTRTGRDTNAIARSHQHDHQIEGGSRPAPALPPLIIDQQVQRFTVLRTFAEQGIVPKPLHWDRAVGKQWRSHGHGYSQFIPPERLNLQGGLRRGRPGDSKVVTAVLHTVEEIVR